MVLSYILPACLYLRLTHTDKVREESETGGGSEDGRGGAKLAGGASAAGGAHGGEKGGGEAAERAGAAAAPRWVWDRRMAWALLIGGCLAAAVCTASTVLAVRSEKKTVQLAHRIAALNAADAAATGRIDVVSEAVNRLETAERRSAERTEEVKRAAALLAAAKVRGFGAGFTAVTGLARPISSVLLLIALI